MLLITEVSKDCVECLQGVNADNKGEVITCVIMTVVGLIIRAVEKKKLLKSKKD